MRADPYRWAIVTLPELPAAAPAPREAILPDSAAQSVLSPQSVAQSAVDDVPLGGWAALPEGSIRIVSATGTGSAITTVLKAARSGVARLFVWDGANVLGQHEAAVVRGRNVVDVILDVPQRPGETLSLLVSFEHDDANEATALQVR